MLLDAELALVWKAAVETEWPFGLCFLLILTGARREEIGALRWHEIQGDRIELQGSRTKNNEAHTIPLSRQAAALIERLPRVADCEFVLSTTGKTPVSGWSRAKRLLDQAASNLNRNRALPDWRMHDLRRTVATGLQRLGINLQVVEAVLSHVAGSRAGIVGVYQRHTFDAEKRAALDAWARHVEAIVSGKKQRLFAYEGGVMTEMTEADWLKRTPSKINGRRWQKRLKALRPAISTLQGDGQMPSSARYWL